MELDALILVFSLIIIVFGVFLVISAHSKRPFLSPSIEDIYEHHPHLRRRPLPWFGKAELILWSAVISWRGFLLVVVGIYALSVIVF